MWYEHTRIFKYSNGGSILSKRFPCIPGVSNRNVKAADSNGILHRNRYTGQWPFQIDMFDPALGAGADHDFSEAISLRMGLECDFAIAAEDIDWFDDAFVNVLHQVLNWRFEELTVV